MIGPRHTGEVLDPEHDDEQARPEPEQSPDDEPLTAPEPETLPPDPDVNG